MRGEQPALFPDPDLERREFIRIHSLHANGNGGLSAHFLTPNVGPYRIRCICGEEWSNENE